MLDNMITTIKDTHKEKLDDVFEALRREYEWYCVADSNMQKKRHALKMEQLAYKLSDIAQVLYLLE